MSAKNLTIKYHCQHPSCQVFCKKGELTLEEGNFEELKGAYEEDDIFKSPRGTCRMGYNQPFKIVSVSDESAAEDVQVDKGDGAADPIEILKAEHLGVISKLENLEEQLRQRSKDGLWTAAADLENKITLHSIKKEEEGLFPILMNKNPMAQAFVQIVHEDHKEFISLLHSFRCGLQEDQILDGIVNSLITNLKNHIRKEDDEFFTMVDECLTAEDRALLLGRMEAIESKFVPVEPGDRHDKSESPFLENRKVLDAEIKAVIAENCTDDWSCH
ncbi:MAG: hemerythrin domain-containing protein [Thermodesulfobacteriota bacterium]